MFNDRTSLAIYEPNLPLEVEQRTETITQTATSKVIVVTPTQHILELDINLNFADARDLKSLVQQRTGVPVQQQILRYKYPARFEVKEGRPLIEHDVGPNSVLILELKPEKVAASPNIIQRAKR